MKLLAPLLPLLSFNFSDVSKVLHFVFYMAKTSFISFETNEFLLGSDSDLIGSLPPIADLTYSWFKAQSTKATFIIPNSIP